MAYNEYHHTWDEKEELEAICNQKLGPHLESQCLSAQFVDKDGQPILFNFGEHIIRDEEDPPVVWKVFDGLHVSLK